MSVIYQNHTTNWCENCFVFISRHEGKNTSKVGKFFSQNWFTVFFWGGGEENIFNFFQKNFLNIFCVSKKPFSVLEKTKMQKQIFFLQEKFWYQNLLKKIKNILFSKKDMFAFLKNISKFFEKKVGILLSYFFSILGHHRKHFLHIKLKKLKFLTRFWIIFQISKQIKLKLTGPSEVRQIIWHKYYFLNNFFFISHFCIVFHRN